MNKVAESEVVPLFYPQYRVALIEVAKNQGVISEQELAEILEITVSDIQKAQPYCLKYDMERQLPLLSSLVAEHGKHLSPDLRQKILDAIKKAKETSLH